MEINTVKLSRYIAPGLLAGALALPTLAHHSFVAQFDPNKPRTIAGTVTKLEWTNPHARFFVDVKDAKGKVTNFEVELGSPNKLLRYGWNRKSMKSGDSVTVEGFDARNGAALINAKSVKFADGRSISAGSSLQDDYSDKK
jgi:Family of unknown function (DUF6152)